MRLFGGTWCSLLCLCMAARIHAQQVFINQVQEYSSLSPCPEAALSTVVRDMYSGCGDGGKTTSYSCFCTASSSQFASIISTAVMKACNSSSNAASSAAQVFDAYCQLGVPVTNATSSAPLLFSTVSVGATATNTVAVIIAPSQTSTTATATGGAASVTPDQDAQSSGLSPTARTAIIATCVVVGVLLFAGVTAFIMVRRRRQVSKAQGTTVDTPVFNDHGKPELMEAGSSDMYEVDASERKFAVKRVVEMPS